MGDLGIFGKSSSNYLSMLKIATENRYDTRTFINLTMGDLGIFGKSSSNYLSMLNKLGKTEKEIEFIYNVHVQIMQCLHKIYLLYLLYEKQILGISRFDKLVTSVTFIVQWFKTQKF